MGEIFAEVVLKVNGKELKKKILVARGSTFTWIHSDTLQKLGVTPVDN